jgi:hypothetical protein
MPRDPHREHHSAIIRALCEDRLVSKEPLVTANVPDQSHRIRAGGTAT